MRDVVNKSQVKSRSTYVEMITLIINRINWHINMSVCETKNRMGESAFVYKVTDMRSGSERDCE